ncbi:hypothetical protein GCM10011354_27600 [Egicoccus halophilus]|uniref:PAS domain S-box-containing protein/diguanylate cyclase (GGDEF) domain-containing protein n=2 Tax=Egicoccus halophilus TaxID=1670830 RepID=A0A8J3EUZ0_9ACTN|nr:hypothetical protein GCM10011354_27600 [Egicoccus halophilus]
MQELHGLAPGAFDGRLSTALACLHPDDRDGARAWLARRGGVTYEYRVVLDDGSIRWLEAQARVVDEDRAIGVVRDVTARHAAEDQLRYRAQHDGLTGLHNRAVLRERLAETTAARRPASLLLLDLDGFKDVNDTFGHSVGDDVLVEVADRLRRTLPDGVLVVRLGGDEFAAVVPGDSGEQVAGELLTALEPPFRLGDLELSIGGSVGVSRTPEHGVDPETLLRRADAAMYRAKAQSGTWHTYRPSDEVRAARRLQLVAQLREALQGEHGPTLVYQPKLDLRTGGVSAVEGLARWRDRDGQEVSPVEFVPLAEQYGLQNALTSRVLDEACRQIARWRDEGLDVGVAVNVSPSVLIDPGFVALVRATIEDCAIPPASVTLEVTETVFAEESDDLDAVLRRLRRLGVQLAIDDFGSGYASIGYLRRLKVDELKLDRSFTFDLLGDRDAEAIVASTIALAHALGQRVVAEGVESAAIRDRLTELGCDVAQGFAIHRPDTAEVIASWLRAGRHGHGGCPGERAGSG